MLHYTYIASLVYIYIHTRDLAINIARGGSKSTMGIRYFNLQRHQVRNSGEECFELPAMKRQVRSLSRGGGEGETPDNTQMTGHM